VNLPRIAAAALSGLAFAAVLSAPAAATPTVEGRYWSGESVSGRYWSGEAVSGRYWSGTPVVDGRYWSGLFSSGAVSGSRMLAI
jgi:hypothetical protein